MCVGAFVLKIVKIMGAIKDIVDLCIKLRDENRDGKISAAISEIQSLTLSLQSEQVAIIEKNSELVTENLGLKRKLLELETSHSQAIALIQDKHRAEIAKITASDARPKGDELLQQTAAILKAFFDSARELSEEEIARHFKLSSSVAAYHLDILWKKKFIGGQGVIIMGGGYGRGGGNNSPQYEITALGRKYIVENGLAG